MGRHVVTEKNIQEVGEELKSKIAQRLEEKGDHVAAGKHDILGIVTEEFLELAEAVRSNDPLSIRSELVDVAVAAMFGVITIDKIITE